MANEKSDRNGNERSAGKIYPGKMREPERIKAGNEKERGKIKIDCRVGDRPRFDQVYGVKQNKKYCRFHYRLPGLILRLKIRYSDETVPFSGAYRTSHLSRCGLSRFGLHHFQERTAQVAGRIADAVDRPTQRCSRNSRCFAMQPK